MDEQEKLLNQLDGRDLYYKEETESTPKTLLSEQRFSPANMASKVIELVQEANSDKDFIKDVLAEMQVQVASDKIEDLEEDMMNFLAYCDGKSSNLEIAERINVSLLYIKDTINKLRKYGVLDLAKQIQKSI